MSKKIKISYALLTLFVFVIMIRDHIIQLTSTGSYYNEMLVHLIIVWGVFAIYVIVNKKEHYRVSIYIYVICSFIMFYLKDSLVNNN